MEAWALKVISGLTPGGAGIWVLVVMAMFYGGREWRENRKLSSEDREAMRSGYSAEVAALRAENRALMEDMREIREEYDAHRKQCQIETDQLRKMVVALEGELEGLKRRVATDAIEILRLKGTPL